MKTLYLATALILTAPLGLLAQNCNSSFQYVEVEGGVTVPIGALKNTMNVAPNVGVWMRKPYTHNSVWAFGLSVNFPKSTTIQYVNDDFETETKSFSGVAGLRLDKSYPLHQEKNVDFIWSSVLGYGFYLFDDVRARIEYESLPPSKKDEDEKPIFIRPFSTVHIGQGIQLRMRDFGIQARYNYAPYALFSDIIDDRFGAYSVSVSLFYRQ